MTSAFTESVVEEAALEWLAALQYAFIHGPAIAPGELLAERKDYGQVILEDRLRQALARLNPKLPAEALEDAFRKIVRVEGSTAQAYNRACHRMLVDGVTVEYRRPDGSIAGAQVRLVDFARTWCGFILGTVRETPLVALSARIQGALDMAQAWWQKNAGRFHACSPTIADA